MNNIAIKLEEVNFSYNKGLPIEFKALKDINLEIYKGEYVSFLGSSGCGKSTMLYIISGVEHSTEGKVIANEMDLMSLDEESLALFRQHDIGFIFQNFNLIPSIKNIDNVMLPLMFSGMAPALRRKRALELLERLEMAHLADRFPHELSGGQQQRIGIARALANDPPIILADEPIGNLDTANAEILLDYLKEINQKEGKTVVMVTHEPWSLRDVTRIFHMQDGAITKVESKIPEKVIAGTSEKKVVPEKDLKLAEAEFQSKKIAPMILSGYSNEEMTRLEEFLKARLLGSIDAEVFRKSLDNSYKMGGVGLWFQTAKKISDIIEKYIAREFEIDSLEEKLFENKEIDIENEVIKFRQWLLEDFDLHLSNERLARLDEILNDRIRKIISTDHFLKIISLSTKEDGVGVNIRTSLRITEKMETVLHHSEQQK